MSNNFDEFNSSTLLATLEDIFKDDMEHRTISLEALVLHTKLAVKTLISLLTELEQRDEIQLDIISTANPGTDDVSYKGNITLMVSPPDEIANLKLLDSESLQDIESHPGKC